MTQPEPMWLAPRSCQPKIRVFTDLRGYMGLYIPVALGLVSFLGVWLIRGNPDIAVALLSESIADTVSELVFASVPLFALVGLIVSKAGLGKDIYRGRQLRLLPYPRRSGDCHGGGECDLRFDHGVFDCLGVGFHLGGHPRDAPFRL